MIKLVLVDDEAISRRGLKTSIHWSSYGIDIVGEAADGEEALEVCRECKPDIVITDIKMPVMDGLEFSRLLKKHNPDIRVIIVSGYDDLTLQGRL